MQPQTTPEGEQLKHIQEQKKPYQLLPRLLQIHVSIITKYLNVSQKLCILSYLNKNWHSFVYSGFAWDSITFERGKNGWRDDVWCFVTKFLDKFTHHQLLRKIDTSTLKIPFTQMKKFVNHLFKFEYVERLNIMSCKQILEDFRFMSSVKKQQGFQFCNLKYLALDQSTSYLISDCDILSFVPNLVQLAYTPYYRPYSQIQRRSYYLPSTVDQEQALDQAKKVHQLIITHPQMNKLIMNNVKNNQRASYYQTIFEPHQKYSVRNFQINGERLELVYSALRKNKDFWKNHLHSLVLHGKQILQFDEDYNIIGEKQLRKLSFQNVCMKLLQLHSIISKSADHLRSLQLINSFTQFKQINLDNNTTLQTVKFILTTIRPQEPSGLKISLKSITNLKHLQIQYLESIFEIESSKSLKLQKFEIIAMKPATKPIGYNFDSKTKILAVEAFEFEQSKVTKLKMVECMMKKEKDIQNLSFNSPSQVTLSSLSFLTNVKDIENIQTLYYSPTFVSEVDLKFLNIRFPKLIVLQLNLANVMNLVDEQPFHLSISHNYVRTIKFTNINKKIIIKISQNCVNLTYVLIENSEKIDLILQSQLIETMELCGNHVQIDSVKVGTDSKFKNLKIMEKNNMQVIDFRGMRKLIMCNLQSFKLNVYLQKFMQLKVLVIQKWQAFNYKQLADILRHSINLQSLQIRFSTYPFLKQKSSDKIVINHKNIRFVSLRDGNQNFKEIQIGKQCQKIEMLEISFFQQFELTNLGNQDMKEVLINSYRVQS